MSVGIFSEDFIDTFYNLHEMGLPIAKIFVLYGAGFSIGKNFVKVMRGSARFGVAVSDLIRDVIAAFIVGYFIGGVGIGVQIFQAMGLEHAGAHGTTAALALLNDQVKKGGVMASSYVGGLSGAFIPVSEDQGMINAVEVGALTLEKLEAMTCVCSVGLDMVAIPGDTKDTTISGIIADEMAIGMINQKTTAVRLIPVIGKGVGETVEFGGLLGYAPIMPVNQFSCDNFVNRGGRIPAPVHSFKN